MPFDPQLRHFITADVTALQDRICRRWQRAQGFVITDPRCASSDSYASMVVAHTTDMALESNACTEYLRQVTLLSLSGDPADAPDVSAGVYRDFRMASIIGCATSLCMAVAAAAGSVALVFNDKDLPKDAVRDIANHALEWDEAEEVHPSVLRLARSEVNIAASAKKRTALKHAYKASAEEHRKSDRERSGRGSFHRKSDKTGDRDKSRHKRDKDRSSEHDRKRV